MMKRGTPIPMNGLLGGGHLSNDLYNNDDNDDDDVHNSTNTNNLARQQQRQDLMMNVGLSEGLATPSTSMDMDEFAGMDEFAEQQQRSFLPMLNSHASSHHDDAPLTTSMDDLQQHDIVDMLDDHGGATTDDEYTHHSQQQQQQQKQLQDHEDQIFLESSPSIAAAAVDSALIVKHIASYLSLSDAESMASLGSFASQRRQPSVSSSLKSQHEQQHDHIYWSHDTKEPQQVQQQDYDNNSIRQEQQQPHNTNDRNSNMKSQYQSWNSLNTPDTPGIMALTPDFLDQEEELPGLMGIHEDEVNTIENNDDVAWEEKQQQQNNDAEELLNGHTSDNDYDVGGDSDIRLRQRLEQKQKRWIQQKLTNAVFSHPKSLRSFCLEAHQAAMEIQRNRNQQDQQQQVQYQEVQQQDFADQNPETLREPHNEIQQGATSSYFESQQPHLQQRHLTTRERQTQHLVKKKKKKHHQQKQHLKFLRNLIDSILHNVPLSVLIDLVEGIVETGLDTGVAIFTLECRALNSIVSGLCFVVHKVWDTILSLNPLKLMDTVISIQFNAVGKTSEVIVSGMQSVATGVGSVSTAALHRLSRAGADHDLHHHHHHNDSSVILDSESGVVLGDGGIPTSKNGGGGGLRRNNTSHHRMLQATEAANIKLIRKLSSINSAAKVVSYREMDEGAAITRHAKKRVQRMMHYDVSLRPFEATVILPQQRKQQSRQKSNYANGNSRISGLGDSGGGDSSSSNFRSFENFDAFASPNQQHQSLAQFQHKQEEDMISPPSSASSSPLGSPFMCTPKSFPPTPSSRQMVMARGTRFVEDVVFLARDQLRVQGALESSNERTRAMAQALREGRRLAVFNAADTGTGIALTCGQHVATKVGNVLYCSTRSMIPVLRNCFVYFEMSVMAPQPILNSNTTSNAAAAATMMMPASLATLSIGLSTLEMPLNTLVGAWKGSVGLCTTGQILSAGRWSSPLDPSLSSYGDGATVGCLACVDDHTAFETWDGVMVTASVTFNVNGTVISPPSSSSPAAGMELATGGLQSQQLPQVPSTGGPTLPLLVPMEEEIFPTLTLHSPTTQVMCRFSAEDIFAKSRASIGAPHGCPIYAIDGSVLFDMDE